MEQLQPRLVQGENVAQAYQFVKTGNAALGFVAYAQVHRTAGQDGSLWAVPQSLYDPIEQQAVQLSRQPGVCAFRSYLQSDRARRLIRSFGYGVP